MQVDLAAASFWTQGIEDRQRGFEALRRASGLTWFAEPDERLGLDPGPRPGFFGVARHDDVRDVCRDDETFRSSPTSFTIGDPAPGSDAGSMIATDNPEHARLRRIVQSAYHARRVARRAEPPEPALLRRATSAGRSVISVRARRRRRHVRRLPDKDRRRRIRVQSGRPGGAT